MWYQDLTQRKQQLPRISLESEFVKVAAIYVGAHRNQKSFLLSAEAHQQPAGLKKNNPVPYHHSPNRRRAAGKLDLNLTRIVSFQPRTTDKKTRPSGLSADWLCVYTNVHRLVRICAAGGELNTVCVCMRSEIDGYLVCLELVAAAATGMENYFIYHLLECGWLRLVAAHHASFTCTV